VNRLELEIVDGRAYFGKCSKVIMIYWGWNLKGIREIFEVPISDCQLAVCISTPIESMIPEQELSLRVLVSSRSNLVGLGE
jgi:hypothetical protein